MPPLGPRNHRISVEEAAQHTRRHRDARGKAHDIHAGAFHKDQVLELLNQKGCTGIRIYLARKPDGSSTFVATGLDAKGEDITAANCTILEDMYPCPPYCPTSSPLNG